MKHPLASVCQLSLALLLVCTALVATDSKEDIEVPDLSTLSFLKAQIGADDAKKIYTLSEVNQGVIIEPGIHSFLQCIFDAPKTIADMNFNEANVWIYEFTGIEPPFTGNVFISDAEREQNQYPFTNTLEELRSARLYYVRTNTALTFSCNDGFSVSTSIVSSSSESSSVSNSVSSESSAQSSSSSLSSEEGLINTDATSSSSSSSSDSLESSDSSDSSITNPVSLFVTQNTVPTTMQMLAGERSKTVLNIKLQAAGGDVEVQALRIGSTAVDVDSLELYLNDEPAPFATATKENCETSLNTGNTAERYLCAKPSQALVITETNPVSISVLANIKTNSSNRTVALSIESNPIATLANGASILSIDATRTDTSTPLGQNDGDGVQENEIVIGTQDFSGNVDIDSNEHQIVLSRIAAISDAHNDQDGSAVPNGNAHIATFAFEGAKNINEEFGINHSDVSQIIFTVDAANIALNAKSIAAFNVEDTGTTSLCTPLYTTGEEFTLANISGLFLVRCSLEEIDSRIDSEDILKIGLSAEVVSSKVNPTATSKLAVSLENLQSQSARTIIWEDADANGSHTIEWVDTGLSSVTSTTYSSE